jgi:hypothetical protein
MPKRFKTACYLRLFPEHGHHHAGNRSRGRYCTCCCGPPQPILPTDFVEVYQEIPPLTPRIAPTDRTSVCALHFGATSRVAKHTLSPRRGRRHLNGPYSAGIGRLGSYVRRRGERSPRLQLTRTTFSDRGRPCWATCPRHATASVGQKGCVDERRTLIANGNASHSMQTITAFVSRVSFIRFLRF